MCGPELEAFADDWTLVAVVFDDLLPVLAVLYKEVGRTIVAGSLLLPIPLEIRWAPVAPFHLSFVALADDCEDPVFDEDWHLVEVGGIVWPPASQARVYGA